MEDEAVLGAEVSVGIGVTVGRRRFRDSVGVRYANDLSAGSPIADPCGIRMPVNARQKCEEMVSIGTW